MRVPPRSGRLQRRVRRPLERAVQLRRLWPAVHGEPGLLRWRVLHRLRRRDEVRTELRRHLHGPDALRRMRQGVPVRDVLQGRPVRLPERWRELRWGVRCCRQRSGPLRRVHERVLERPRLQWRGMRRNVRCPRDALRRRMRRRERRQARLRRVRDQVPDGGVLHRGHVFLRGRLCCVWWCLRRYADRLEQLRGLQRDVLRDEVVQGKPLPVSSSSRCNHRAARVLTPGDGAALVISSTITLHEHTGDSGELAGRMQLVIVQEEEHELGGSGESRARGRRRLAHRAAEAGAVRAAWDGRGGARRERFGRADVGAPRDGGGVACGPEHPLHRALGPTPWRRALRATRRVPAWIGPPSCAEPSTWTSRAAPGAQGA